jgi:hypothetical protein
LILSIPSAPSTTTQKQSGKNRENTSLPRILNTPERIAALFEKQKEQEAKAQKKEEQQEEEKDVRGGLIAVGMLQEKERLVIQHMMRFLTLRNWTKMPKNRSDYLNACRKELVPFFFFFFSFPSSLFSFSKHLF